MAKVQSMKVGKTTVKIKPITPKVVYELVGKGVSLKSLLSPQPDSLGLPDRDTMVALLEHCIVNIEDREEKKRIIDSILESFSLLSEALSILLSDITSIPGAEEAVEKFRR